jgi:hypothetical protein
VLQSLLSVQRSVPPRKRELALDNSGSMYIHGYVYVHM